MSSKSLKFIFVLLFLITLFTRFFNLNWGDSFFFHPDENNMANSILQMNSESLNPNFFAYGQFPLYLTYFTTPRHDFSSIILTLRFWSATFSSLSVLFFYLIVKEFFKNKKTIIISTLFFILTPGLIQAAHFGTTESILIFVFLVNILLSIRILKNFKFKYILLASFFSALALATKVSAILLLTPIFLSLFLIYLKNHKLLTFFKHSFLFLLFTSFLSIIFSPYNLLDFNSFFSSILYEIKVANGQSLVFYTRQFLNTIPYLFQFQKIFPYAISLPVLFLSLFGIFYLPKKSKKLILILLPVLIFFLYQGQLFVKWTRFMAPIFFIFPFFVSFFINKIKNKIILITIVLLSIIPTLLFFQIYFTPDIRIQASNWIVSNFEENSKVISESGNVINIPIGNNSFDLYNFNFYELENNLQLEEELQNLIDSSDYILIPSRRVFKNHNNQNFPKTYKYYQNLFSQLLAFKELKTFNIPTSLFLNPENAEETWTVFDNPTIRIYQKDSNEI